jgi:hypothetical protein
MRTAFSQINTATTTTTTPSLVRGFRELGQRAVKEQRAVTTPSIGLVNNFDPDQIGFLTPTMQGFAMMQVGSGAGTVGRLAVHADYGKKPIESLAKLRLEPGKPTLIYPVAANGPSFNTSFIRGGKETPYRKYPNFPLFRRGGEFESHEVIVIRQDTAPNGVGVDQFFGWGSNAALAPGYRYWEINDWRYWNTSGTATSLVSEAYLISLYGLSSIDDLLPIDPDGVIARNFRPLTDASFATSYAISPAILADDSYWSGTAKNPLEWVEVDEYWQSLGITKESLQAYFDAHPGAKLF